MVVASFQKIRCVLMNVCERILLGTRPCKLDDQELVAMVRLLVHTIEKRNAVECQTNMCDVIKARQHYHEATKRGCLSDVEREWCDQVLFARSILRPEGRDISSHVSCDINPIYNRRSIRQWSSAPITDDEYYALVDAARWAPSSCHRQPWHFILTRDRSKIRAVAQIRGQVFIEKAPCCVVVLMHMRSYKAAEISYTPYLDAGAAIENVLLAAEMQGIGACWVNFGRLEVSSQDRMTAMDMFSIPDAYEIVALIPVGYPAGLIPKAPPRKDISAVASMEMFSL